LGADVSPSNTRETTDSEASGKLAPAISALERIRGQRATREGLDTNLGAFVLESNGTIGRQAQGQDQDQTSSGQAARDFGNISNVAVNTSTLPNPPVISCAFSCILVVVVVVVVTVLVFLPQ